MDRTWVSFCPNPDVQIGSEVEVKGTNLDYPSTRPTVGDSLAVQIPKGELRVVRIEQSSIRELSGTLEQRTIRLELTEDPTYVSEILTLKYIVKDVVDVAT